MRSNWHYYNPTLGNAKAKALGRISCYLRFSQPRKFLLAEKRRILPGYKLTGGLSAPYEYLRDLRALRGKGLFSFGCGLVARGVCGEQSTGCLYLDGSITRVISASQFVSFLSRIEHERVALKKF
jgi:hypothetical protein